MTVTKPIYDYIFQHLAEFHNNKMKIINSFAYDFDEYMQMLNFAKKYINKCERFLGDATTIDGNDELPFVIFNCIVQLSSDSDEELSCCITLPKEEYELALAAYNVTPIPCNLPPARELIFKRCGESVVFENSGESHTYTIRRIELNPFIPLDQNEL